VLVTHEPASYLRPYVRRYYGFSEETGGLTRRREGPGAEVVVLISFGSEWRIGEATDPARPAGRYTSFAAGLRLSSVITEHDGVSRGMQVSLTPPGAYALFGEPMHELTGYTVALDSLLGADAERLRERLVELRDWPERFALVEASLSKRLADASRPTPGVLWAWRRLSETQGRQRIGALTAELGWSRKRLVARFREEVGLGPKSVARLLRFERAAALLESSAGPDLAVVAADCGFSDQAHMTNEFRTITGITPATFFQDTQRPSL
jgi:AraC-like DNA-binding protein